MTILRASRCVADRLRAEAFYGDVLGFRIFDRFEKETIISLGDEEVALVQAGPAARPYPADSRSDDLWFQHLAIVVSDMDAAYAQLRRHAGWHPITEGGPQVLPPDSGNVRAFKFRDPDGFVVQVNGPDYVGHVS